MNSPVEGNACRVCRKPWRIPRIGGANPRWDYGGAYRELCPRCWAEWSDSAEYLDGAARALPDPMAYQRWLEAKGVRANPMEVASW